MNKPELMKEMLEDFQEQINNIPIKYSKELTAMMKDHVDLMKKHLKILEMEDNGLTIIERIGFLINIISNILGNAFRGGNMPPKIKETTFEIILRMCSKHLKDNFADEEPQ